MARAREISPAVAVRTDDPGLDALAFVHV